MTPWNTLFKRSSDIALGAPQVIATRLSLMNQPGPWPLATMLEAQRMVWEKMLAASEIWWGWYRAALMAPPWPAFGSKHWHRPRTQLRLAHHHASSANRALGPLARTVNANVRRLKRR